MSLPLCVRVDSEDRASVEALLSDKWTHVEQLLIYSGRVHRTPHAHVHHIHRSEIDEVLRIAEHAFITSRVYRDNHISSPGLIKRNWIEREIDDTTCETYVYSDGGFVTGFVTMRDARVLHIAVTKKAQRMGVGRALLLAAGPGLLVAATQEDNQSAKMLYLKTGLNCERSLETFHKWP